MDNSARRWCRPGGSATTTHRGGGQKDRQGTPSTHKDVKNEGRSGNVYENKESRDNLPDTKDDICARLHAILHKITLILQEPSAHLS
jgi:hypothetical protein